MRTCLLPLLFLTTTSALTPAAEPAIVLHADVPKLLATPLGATLRDTPNFIVIQAHTITEAFGLTPGDLTTINAAFDISDKTRVSTEIAASKPFASESFQKSGTPSPLGAITFPNPKLLQGQINGGAGSAADAVKRLEFGPSFLAVALAPSRLPPLERQAFRAQFSGELARFAPLLDADLLRLQLSAEDTGPVIVSMICQHPEAAKRAELKSVLSTFLKVATTVATVYAADDRQPGRGQPTRFDFQQLSSVLKAATVTDTPAGAKLTLTLPRDFSLTAFLPTLIGLETPSTVMARRERSNHLKQIGLAFHNFENSNGQLPTASISKDGKPLLSWRVAVLPFLGENELYQKFKLNEPWDSDHNKKLIPLMPAVYAEPAGSDTIPAHTTRAQVFVGKDTIFAPNVAKGIQFSDITDGMSNTILVATAAKPVTWTKPDELIHDPKADPRKMLRFTNTVTAVGFGDGSVRWLKFDNPPEEWHKLITRNDGMVIMLDESK